MSTTTLPDKPASMTTENTSWSLSKSVSVGISDADLTGRDEEQIRLMNEICIVVDENDKPIDNASKKVCHLMENIEKGLLHRAFSVFLFDNNNRLLLQQRASEKITFPDRWTNTCCSHPLAVPDEMGVDLSSSIIGVQRAAQRKLSHELGIPEEEVLLGEFEFLTRIHYLAASDRKWGEHEIDYILFLKPGKGAVTLEPNPNEVRDTRWVSVKELQGMLQDPRTEFTPWFKLICKSTLFKWWEHLDSGLENFREDGIRRM